VGILASMKSRRYVRTAVLTLALLFCIGVVFVLTRTPSNDRIWAPEFAKLNTIEQESDHTLLFRNVRDWTYVGTTTASTEWRDLHVDPNQIKSAWFFIDFFNTSSHLIAHTFISFEFSDGSTIAFSIEARREASEDYSVLGGFVRAYELQYLWGTERDFISERVVHDVNPMRMYRLALTPDQTRAVFDSMVEETNALAAEPRFYNSITANCTNLLAKIVDTHYPGTLPYDISWQLTGFSDTYLMREGFIALKAGSETATEQAADLGSQADAIAALTTEEPNAFSTAIRNLFASI
jgi:hypothetical protein